MSGWRASTWLARGDGGRSLSRLRPSGSPPTLAAFLAQGITAAVPHSLFTSPLCFVSLPPSLSTALASGVSLPFFSPFFFIQRFPHHTAGVVLSSSRAPRGSSVASLTSGMRKSKGGGAHACVWERITRNAGRRSYGATKRGFVSSSRILKDLMKCLPPPPAGVETLLYNIFYVRVRTRITYTQLRNLC